MKETEDIDKYRKVLHYYTNDDGSEEFSTGSGKFDLQNQRVSQLVYKVEELQEKHGDQMINFQHDFKTGYFPSDCLSCKLLETFLIFTAVQ